ncbi:MAG: GAK system ATP-grasp enzyme [Desulfovibrio sp.]|nr:GAK system ATP-grasp enzyme [Desulfovibrio sp.]
MRIGVVGVPGGESSEKLADAVADVTGTRILVSMDNVRLDLPSGRCFHNGMDISALNALIIKKIGSRYSPDLLDRLEILCFLADRGVRVFSDPYTILRMLDRLGCTLRLQAAGVPMPPTTITESPEQALRAIRRYGRAVLKPLYTSKAKGMRLVDGGDSGLPGLVADHAKDNAVIYAQKALRLENNLDLGVVFLGRDYLTTYARVKAENAWNTTTANGGRYAPFAPDAAVLAVARKARDVFDLVFTCVDVAVTDDGPLVFEVSAFGGFRGVEETTDLNPAALVAEHLLARMGEPAAGGKA